MAVNEYILIRGCGSISPVGYTKATVLAAYSQVKPGFTQRLHQGKNIPVGALGSGAEEKLTQLQSENKNYQSLDRSVLMAIYAGRMALADTGWDNSAQIGINIGSSRGATGLYEQYVENYLNTGKVAAQASPVTTLGNISSWVAHDLGAQGPLISHSVTCSTALQAVANGYAWLKAGLADKFLVGAAEAPLTDFTLAQMNAIGIYAPSGADNFPCRPLNLERKNSFVLGEGAAIFALEGVSDIHSVSDPDPLIALESVGFGLEKIESKTGISKEGIHFQLAIRDALSRASSPETIDLIIMHAPGTVAGDGAEWHAIQTIFKDVPVVTSNKFLVGHTLGASAALSLEYALHILKTQSYLDLPYPNSAEPRLKKPINRILLTAAGFGGNAAAIIVKRLNPEKDI